MKSIYFENDDILQIRVSDKSIVREVEQVWHTNISYAEDGSIVEIVLLDAKKEGLLPLEHIKTARSLKNDILRSGPHKLKVEREICGLNTWKTMAVLTVNLLRS